MLRVTEFDDQLWISVADHVVVHSKEDIRVMYRDGIEKNNAVVVCDCFADSSLFTGEILRPPKIKKLQIFYPTLLTCKKLHGILFLTKKEIM